MKPSSAGPAMARGVAGSKLRGKYICGISVSPVPRQRGTRGSASRRCSHRAAHRVSSPHDWLAAGVVGDYRRRQLRTGARTSPQSFAVRFGEGQPKLDYGATRRETARLVIIVPGLPYGRLHIRNKSINHLYSRDITVLRCISPPVFKRCRGACLLLPCWP